MTPFRRGLATTVVLGLIVSHGLVLLKEREVWPFCAYAMYSWIQKPEADAIRLVGVREGAGREEVPLDDAALLHPFVLSRVSDALRTLGRAQDGPRRIHEATADALRRYESRRSAGLHDGPPLVALRAYWVLFRLEPGARNLDHPDERRLLAEVRLPEKGLAP